MTRDFYPLHALHKIEDTVDGEQRIEDVYWDQLTSGDFDSVDGSERIRTSLLIDRILHTKLADNIPAEIITQLLISADENQDGYIDKREFNQLLSRTRRLPKLREALRESIFFVVPRSGRDVTVRRYIDEYSCWPPVIFMPCITAIEIGVFIYYAVIMSEPVTGAGPCPIDSVLIYNPSRRYEAWRFVSYMLIHSGWVHLVNNLLVQLLLGIILEMVHKWWRIMLIYFMGVLGGGLASSIATPYTYLAGASGGVYAIEYAYIGNLILNWGEMKFPIIQLIILLTLSSIDVGYGIFDIYFSSNPSNTGHLAHLGGALTGVLVGVNVLRNLKHERWEDYCWWAAFVLLAILFISAIVFNIVSPGEYFPVSDHSPV